MITFNRLNKVILSLVLCSASVLIAAVYFQYVLGLAPCKLCVWQRFPHVFAIIIGALILFNPKFKLVGALSALVSILVGTYLAGYHVGIEAKFWPGPKSCSGLMNIKELTPELFLQRILTTKVIRCDEIPWSFLNISMAGWNLVISFFLTIIWGGLLLFILKSSNTRKL